MSQFNICTYNTSNQTDENLKEEGNRLFKIKQYENAIQCYSIAIVSTKLIIFH